MPRISSSRDVNKTEGDGAPTPILLGKDADDAEQQDALAARE
jgi:hypothetical protein